MEKDAKYFTAGLFVSGTLLALVVFVVWLAGVHRSGDYARYTVYFTDPVSGLDEDAKVKYKGVEVGKTLSMQIATNKTDLIKVDIEIKSATPINARTTAKIELQGITGQSYIELASEGEEKTPPQRMPNEKYPVIKGNANQFSKRFYETLASIDALSKSTAVTADSIRALIEKLKEDPSQVINPSARKGVEIPK